MISPRARGNEAVEIELGGGALRLRELVVDGRAGRLDGELVVAAGQPRRIPLAPTP